MPGVSAFKAPCPACGRVAAFLPVRIEKAVLTREQAAREDKPGFEGFRCMACRKVQTEVSDTEGRTHRWTEGAPIAE